MGTYICTSSDLMLEILDLVLKRCFGTYDNINIATPLIFKIILFFDGIVQELKGTTPS